MRARSGNVAADPDNLCGGVVFIAFRSLRGGVTGHATSGEVEFPPPPVVCPFVVNLCRTVELAEAIQQGTATVVEREGRITGYATVLAFFGHATAETDLDLEALIASVDSFGGPGILLPSQNSGLFRWCLANRLRVVQPLTLMSIGLYNEPAGAWLPSITF